MSTELDKVEDAGTEQKRSLLNTMALRFGMEPKAFEATIKQTVMPSGGKDVSNAEFAAFLLVAKEYNLNPITKEIYAYPKRGGGIQPVVGVDGWCRIINEHAQLNGIDFIDDVQNGIPVSVTCKIYRKDRQVPISVTEYYKECKMETDPWRKYPMRMLRHKALIQCARYAFGFSGIVEPDELERINSNVIDISASPSRSEAESKLDAIKQQLNIAPAATETEQEVLTGEFEHVSS